MYVFDYRVQTRNDCMITYRQTSANAQGGTIYRSY